MRTQVVSSKQFEKFINELSTAQGHFSSTQELYNESYRNFGKIEDIYGEEMNLAVEYSYHNGKMECCNAELTDEDCNAIDLTLSDEQYKQLDRKLESVLL